MKYQEIKILIIISCILSCMPVFISFNLIDCGKKKLSEKELSDISNYLNNFYKSENRLKTILSEFYSPDCYMLYTEYFNGGSDSIFFSQMIRKNEKIISNKINQIGVYKSYEIDKITFFQNIYDVSENDLYVIGCEVYYEKIKSYESFYLHLVNGKYRLFYYGLNVDKI